MEPVLTDYEDEEPDEVVLDAESGEADDNSGRDRETKNFPAEGRSLSSGQHI
jgi:hypothetical protein